VSIAATEEQARSVADVLLRRTRLGILAADKLRDARSVQPIAETLGGELGWSEERIADETGAWLEVARAEGVDPAGSVS
jgi:glycerol-3-phosphate dehydrogenase